MKPLYYIGSDVAGHVLALLRQSLVVVVLLLMPSAAGAECITPGRWSLDQPSVELVFSGNVVAVNQVADAGVRVTFNVDRIWKGSVPKRFDLYVWQLDAEMPRLDFAGRYVVFATTMTGRSRQGVGLTDRDGLAFRPVDCGALDYAAPQSAKAIKELGEGQPPK